MASEQIQHLRLDQIDVEPQIREFDDESLAGLVSTIQSLGKLLQPILVRKVGDKYTVIEGHRRFRAAQLAKLAKIAVSIEENDLDDGEVLQRQIIANVQREDLSPLEKAKAISRMMSAMGCTASEAAAKLGLTASMTSRLLSLLSLSEELQQEVAAGQIPASAAFELAKIDDVELRARFAQELIGGNLTRDGLAGARKAARKRPGEKASAAPVRATAVLGDRRSITVASDGLDLETFIGLLEEVLAKARKARPSGVALQTFMAMLRDQAGTA